MKIKFSKKIRKDRCLLVIISAFITFTTLVMEECTQRFVDSMTFEIAVFSGLIVLYIVLAVFRYIKQYFLTKLAKNGNFEGQAQLVKRVLSKDYSFFEANEAGGILYSMTEDLYQSMAWYTYGVLQFVLESVNLACFSVYMFCIDRILSLTALVLVVLSLLWANRLSGKLGMARNAQQEQSSELNQYMLSVGRCRNTIKQLDKSGYFIQKYDTYIKNSYLPVINKVIKNNALFITQLIFSQEILPFMMLFAGVVLTILGKSTIGTAVIMMDLTIKLSGAVQSIADLFPQRSLSLAIEKRIETMLEEGDSQDTATKLPVESFERMNIHIDGYRFAQAGKTVLKSTDIELTKGDICVIKGTSGGGKSTLAKLIAGLLRLEGANCIQYNGIRIDRLSIKEYHKHVLYAGQDTVLFEGTLRDNILMEQNVKEEELEEAIEICGLREFVTRYGLDYSLALAGENVSGGERQRIGIARMIVRRPELLILDEVTSALDADTARKVAGNILAFARKHEMTVIAISHKKDFEAFGSKVLTIG